MSEVFLPQTLIIDAYAIYIQTGNTDELNKFSIISLKGESGNTIYNEKEFGVVWIDAYFYKNDFYDRHSLLINDIMTQQNLDFGITGVVIPYSKTL